MGSCLSKQSEKTSVTVKRTTEEIVQEAAANDQSQAEIEAQNEGLRQEGELMLTSTTKASNAETQTRSSNLNGDKHDEGQKDIVVGESASAPAPAKRTLAEQAKDLTDSDFDPLPRETASEPAGVVSISPTDMSSSPVTTELKEQMTTPPEDQQDNIMDNKSPLADQPMEETLPNTEVTTLSEDIVQGDVDITQEDSPQQNSPQEDSPQEDNPQEESNSHTVQMDAIQSVMVIVTEPTPDPSVGSELGDHEDISCNNGAEEEEPEMVTLFISKREHKDGLKSEENADLCHQYRLSLKPQQEGWVECASFKAFAHPVDNTTEIFVSEAGVNDNSHNQYQFQISLDGGLDKDEPWTTSFSFFAHTTEIPGTQAIYVSEKGSDDPSTPSIYCLSLLEDAAESGWQHLFVFYAFSSD